MKRILTLTVLTSLVGITKAQLAGGDAFMLGNYVQVGIENDGGYEGANCTIAAPHTLPGVNFRSGNPYFGFVADPSMAGWVGSGFDGDFFTPGSPENGWGITIQDGAIDVNANNNRSGFPATPEIPGALTGYSTTGTCINVDWSGDYTSSYDLHFDINYFLNVNDLFYTTTVTITNNGTTTIPTLYYHRNFDPDNNQPISSDFTTTNKIVSQPNASSACVPAHVSATSAVPWLSYIGIAAIGSEFRATYGGFSNRDAADIWNGVGFTQTVGDSAFLDQAISMAYRIQNLAPGASETFKFVIILDDAAATNAINNLFYFNYTGSFGGPPPSCVVDIDSVQACPGNPVTIDLMGSALSGFTWTWSPGTGLSTTVGTTVDASPSVNTMYTVTGTPSDPLCPTVTQQIYVESINGPDAVWIDPGPQCSQYDLSTLVWSDINAVPGTGSGFYSTPLTTLADTSTGMFTGTIITSTDTVYLVIWDPVLGCYDNELIDLTWGGLVLNETHVEPNCNASDGSVTLSTPSPTGSELYSSDSLTWVSSPTFGGLAAGTYQFWIDDGSGSGCATSISVTLVSGAGPTIVSATSTPEACLMSCDGSITIVGGPTVTGYSITGGGPTSGSGSFGSVCSGNYTAYVVDANGCFATQLVTVTTLSPMIMTVSPTDTVCIGQTATITATVVGGVGTITYTWDNSLPNAASQTIDPAGTTVYTVFASDGSGCTTPPLSIIVVENPPLSVVAVMDQTVCIGATAPITANASGGDGNINYVWTNTVTGGLLVGANQNVTPTAVTDYIVTVTDGCTTPAMSDTITIDFFPMPAVFFTSDITSGCSPITVNFTNTTNAALTASCLWNFGDGTTSINCSDIHVFSVPQSYDISLTVTTVNGCIVDTVITNYITAYPYPVADFVWTPNPTDIFTPEINFVNTTSGGNTYAWNFAGLGNSTLTNPTFSFPQDSGGTYPVCMLTVNNFGCADTICHNVIIDGVFLLYAPNAFTPNGDGVNDVFIPYLKGERPETYSLLIFDRWGELIFKSTDEKLGWDGTNKNMKAKEDVYVWKIKVKDAQNSDTHEKTGSVTLLR